jgi:hypothetical protein
MCATEIDGQILESGTLAWLQNPEAFAAWLRPLFRSKWLVYAKRPCGGAQPALRYLRPIRASCRDFKPSTRRPCRGMVIFRWRDSAHKNKKRLMTLPVNEFLRRFLLHRAAAWIRPHPSLRPDGASHRCGSAYHYLLARTTFPICLWIRRWMLHERLNRAEARFDMIDVLFVPERDSRIKLCGAACRKITRQNRGHQQDERNEAE